MRRKTLNLLMYCQHIDFGQCALSENQSVFYRRFNNELVSLSRSMPQSAQTDAMLFLMSYSGLNPGDELDFFANYYAPIWSMLYWLSNYDSVSTKQLNDDDLATAISAQSMAMFLHALDDHLVDNQVPVSPLTVMLRTQAWMIMTRSLYNLSGGLPAGDRVVQSFIDDYYSSSQDSEKCNSFDCYCDLFRMRMAILMIAPILLSMKVTDTEAFTRDVEIAYGSFGIAWRLLDDIRDIDEDMKKGAESSIYLCLPENLKTHWKGMSFRNRTNAAVAKKVILAYLFECNIIREIEKRICAELEAAAAIVEGHKITGLAREFRCHAYPFLNSNSDW